MLNTAPVRLIHLGERDTTILLRADQLKAGLAKLELVGLQTRTALAGTVMRFSATKAD